ncbi:MAG: hypothetical protein RLZ61_2030 [Planctomycetota bacterium]
MNILQKPTIWVITAIALALLACGLNILFPALVILRVSLLVIGFIIGLSGFSIACSQRLHDTTSNGVLSLTTFGLSFTLFVITNSMDASWDSLILASSVFTGVCLFIGIFVLLPVLAKKTTAICFVLFHFASIVSAVTSIEPPNAPASWLATNLWAYYFRHYLTFAYLNNAYHFYSPEPGPPVLLWSKIQYEDGTFRWFKIPNRTESPIQMHYQRMLSVTESTNVASSHSPDNWEEKLQRRNLAGLANQPQITPLNRSMSQSYMFKEPADYSKRMLLSYALYLTKKFAHPADKPSINIDNIKIYRVTHSIITPGDMSRGENALDPTLYYPYFMGSFDKNANLINPNDPFLYFLLPITRNSNPNEPTVLNHSLDVHAGDVKIIPEKDGGKP